MARRIIELCAFYLKGIILIFIFRISVYRAGEQGRFWYAVLGGSLEVRYHAAEADTDGKVSLLH